MTAAPRDEAAESSSTSNDEARSIVWRFFFVSLIIASSHSCIVTVLVLSAPVLGEHLGGVAAAGLYVSWVGSCLLAPFYMPILRTPRRALLVGLFGNASYLASFTVAVSNISSGWPLAARYALVVGGSCLGGLANGPIHVSQAVYFANSASALAHARDDGDGGASARALLSGMFALIFTGEEVLLKLLAGLASSTVIFLAYTACGGTCALLATCLLPHAPQPGTATVAVGAGAGGTTGSLSSAWSRSSGSGAAPRASHASSAADEPPPVPAHDAGPPGVLAVLRMLWREPIARLAVLYAVSFGYVSAFEGVVIATRGVAAGPLGEKAVGPATAIVAGAAAVSSVPLSLLSIHVHPRWGRALVAVLFGPVAYVALGLFLALDGSSTDDDNPKTAGGSFLACHAWPTLAAAQVLLGLGRAAWESVSAAATVEFFGGRPPAELSTLMAARSMCNGVGAATAFLLVPNLRSRDAAYALVGLGAAAGAAFLAAAALHHHRDDRAAGADDDGADGLEARLVGGHRSPSCGSRVEPSPLLMLGPGSLTRGSRASPKRTSFKLDTVVPMPSGLAYRRAASHITAVPTPQTGPACTRASSEHHGSTRGSGLRS